MTPFADDNAATSIGDMQVENGLDRIAMYGSLDLTRDKAGLALAHGLRSFLDRAIAILEADHALPAAIPAPKKDWEGGEPLQLGSD